MGISVISAFVALNASDFAQFQTLKFVWEISRRTELRDNLRDLISECFESPKWINSCGWQKRCVHETASVKQRGMPHYFHSKALIHDLSVH